MEKLRAKLNNSFDIKKLSEFEINKKYQASYFQFINTKISIVLDDNFKIVLMEGYLKHLKNMN